MGRRKYVHRSGSVDHEPLGARSHSEEILDGSRPAELIGGRVVRPADDGHRGEIELHIPGKLRRVGTRLVQECGGTGMIDGHGSNPSVVGLADGAHDLLYRQVAGRS